LFSLFLSWPRSLLQPMALTFKSNLVEKFTWKKTLRLNSGKNFLSDHLKTKPSDDKKYGNHLTSMAMVTWVLLKLTRDAETCSDLINYSRQSLFLWERINQLEPSWKLQPHTVTTTFQRLNSNTYFNTCFSIILNLDHDDDHNFYNDLLSKYL
jgi:hypothetical protein